MTMFFISGTIYEEEIMENVKKREKSWRILFVYHPIGFVAFLVLGAAVFLGVSSQIQVPVYTSVKTNMEKVENGTRIDRKGVEVWRNSPIYMYQSREDSMEEVSSYEIDGKYIFLRNHEPGKHNGEGEIFLDIQTGQETLLKLIFTSGGENGRSI